MWVSALSFGVFIYVRNISSRRQSADCYPAGTYCASIKPYLFALAVGQSSGGVEVPLFDSVFADRLSSSNEQLYRLDITIYPS